MSDFSRSNDIGHSGTATQKYSLRPNVVGLLIEKCHESKIDCIVAPYQAAAQTAFFNLRGMNIL